MKQFLTLAAVVLAFAATPALADHHEGHKGPKGDHKGKMFEKHDVDGDGAISKEEFIVEAQKRFEKMDTDGNGEVSKEEARAAHEEIKEKMKERLKKRMEHRKEKAEGGESASDE